MLEYVMYAGSDSASILSSILSCIYITKITVNQSIGKRYVECEVHRVVHITSKTNKTKYL